MNQKLFTDFRYLLCKALLLRDQKMLHPWVSDGQTKKISTLLKKWYESEYEGIWVWHDMNIGN